MIPMTAVSRWSRNNFPEVEIIANESNVGYSKAINQAIRPSLGKYILILNADTIVTPGAIQTLLSFMENTIRIAAFQGPNYHIRMENCSTPTEPIRHSKPYCSVEPFLGNIFPGSKVLRDHLMLDWDHCSRARSGLVTGFRPDGQEMLN